MHEPATHAASQSDAAANLARPLPALARNVPPYETTLAFAVATQSPMRIAPSDANTPSTATHGPEDDFRKAVDVGDWVAAATALDQLPDATIQRLITPLPPVALASLDSAARDLAAIVGHTNRVHRNIVFKTNALPPAQPHPDKVRVVKPGTKFPTRQVDGGEVVVHTDAILSTPEGDPWDAPAFSVQYRGKEAATTRWLQFIWREFIVVHPTKGEYRIAGAIETRDNVPWQLTTDPAHPYYLLDVTKPNPERAGHPDTPFYEGEALNNRDAHSTTIFDAPDAQSRFAWPAFKGRRR